MNAGARPLLVHVTTTDITLDWLLGPQLEAFRDAGFDVVGVSAPGPHVEALESRGIRHVPLLHATRAHAPGEDARALVEMYRLFRRLRPTIVHTHNPKPGVLGRPAARAARVPVVVNTVHGLYALPEDRVPKRALVYGLERLATACCDATLLQNPEDLPVLRRLRVPERKLRLLGNGVDLGAFDVSRISADERAKARAELGATEPGDVVVGVVGRLVQEKGYAEVFSAAEALRRTFPSVRIGVVGPDDAEKSDALSEPDRDRARVAGVRFLGARRDMPRLYAGMDLFVLASHREGFPRSAIEAAAMGVPVIATDIRGCRQVVDDGVTGLLVPVRDPRALAGAIEKLAADPGLRATMGRAARAKAEREFDQRRCVEITLSVYRELLARKGVSMEAVGPEVP